MERWTARAYHIALAWLDGREREPSRSDWYTMALTAEVRALPFRVWGKQGPDVLLKDFRLVWETVEEKVKRTAEEVAKDAKDAALARVGMTATVVTISKEENERRMAESALEMDRIRAERRAKRGA